MPGSTARVEPLTKEQRMYWKSVCQNIVSEEQSFEKARRKIKKQSENIRTKEYAKEVKNT